MPTRPMLRPERAVAACPEPPLYARVNLVLTNASNPAVMELELIEPELWLRFHPPAAMQMTDVQANLISI